MRISKRLRFAVLQRDGFKCRYCGATAAVDRLEVDHVVAVANGGPDIMANLVTSCFHCNRGKKAYPLPHGELVRIVRENVPQRPALKPFRVHPGPPGIEHIGNIIARIDIGPH